MKRLLVIGTLVFINLGLICVVLYKNSLSEPAKSAAFENPLFGLESKSNRFPDQVKIEVILLGDIMLGRTVMTTSLDRDDPLYPFRKVGDTLRDADIVFANLENPIIQNCPRHFTGFTFCADPKLIDGLTYSGINVVNIANNHTLNYGVKGFAETKAYLQKNDVSFTGDHNLVIKEIGGVKFGFLGFDFLSKSPTDEDFELVSSASSKVDVLIVGVHWGVEYQSLANTFQKNTAKKLVELGADVISGHHPHWVQDDEKINGKPVYYSLGNFVFDQMWSEETKKGMAVRLTFQGKEVAEEEKLPVYIKERGQPEFMQ